MARRKAPHRPKARQPITSCRRGAKSHLDPNKYIICQVCGKSLQRITPSHLAIHNMTAKDYKEKFGVAYVVSKALRLRASRQMTMGADRGYVPRDLEEILEALRELHRGKNPLYPQDVANADKALFCQVDHVFGDWSRAFAAAGIEEPPARNRSWTREKVIEAIRNLAAKGTPLTHSEFKKVDSGVVNAAIRRFGTWAKAARASGCRYVKPFTNWSPEHMQRVAARWVTKHGPLNTKDLMRTNPNLLYALKRAYGRLRSAATGLGLPFLTHCRKWDRDSLLAALRRLKRNGMPLTDSRVRKADQGVLLASIRFFGSWKRAVTEAGYDLATEQELARKWTPEKVLNAIRDRAGRNESIRQKEVLLDNRRLVSAARRYFGNWGRALEAAGRKR